MEAGALLVGARLAHYLGALVLFGAVLFPAYAFGDVRPPEDFFARLKTVSVAAAALALAGAVAVLSATAANMAGDLAAAVDPETLGLVVAGTGFGRVWAVRLLLGAVLLALALVLRGEARARFLVPLSGLFLASVALTGHAKAEPGAAGWIHVLADALHLPAAGAWLGALVPLGWLATRRPGSAATAEAMRRFGGVGSAAVATLLLTGLVNAWFLVGLPGKLVTTLYGRLLGVKLLLFLGMLALATLNRFRLVPALVEDPGAIRRLRAHVVGEQVLGLAVVAVVALLGTIDPSA